MGVCACPSKWKVNVRQDGNVEILGGTLRVFEKRFKGERRVFDKIFDKSAMYSSHSHNMLKTKKFCSYEKSPVYYFVIKVTA